MAEIEYTMIQKRQILKTILIIRGKKVIIDSDLAELYGVKTKRLNEQVKRNQERFPSDFMFQLAIDEKTEVVSNCDHLVKLKYSRSLPYAFTEHGAIMAANVLSSKQAIKMSVYIVRAFVQLREMVLTNERLALKVDQLESRVIDHDEILIDLIQELKAMVYT
ncbi:ORF6N domain-containing protein, partial [Thermodesulfobacteriota bacterium]